MKVLIVDDHPIVLSGCRALLAEAADMTMLEARDAATAQEVYAAHKPDVAVIDINLPDISGFELARRLQVRDPRARIIMFSMNDDPMFAAQAIEGGAKGYVSKSDDPQAFLNAIREVYAGGHSLPLAMAQKIAFLRNAGESVVLTSREREVLRLLAKGKSMSEIAALINVSYKTVATTCASLRAKFNARTPMQLIRIAVEQKIV
ncbi:MAG: response regulator transcription factor [Hyphomicrobium sp.]|uniref:response regulator transcription factor n=1 Tax=Hyphomicrobium sp. TaxID=82 RepID=UPI00132C5C34|nr:response regulator transcription factor [Hyphomicrobium sp.]KAB2942926.1 MAG: response regulator transcription factor [Hyphomicrobium sp.]MBZ0210804.1 response regulator transcription factor [Hyphomicrobium sp.]